MYVHKASSACATLYERLQVQQVYTKINKEYFKFLNYSIFMRTFRIFQLKQTAEFHSF